MLSGHFTQYDARVGNLLEEIGGLHQAPTFAQFARACVVAERWLDVGDNSIASVCEVLVSSR